MAVIVCEPTRASAAGKPMNRFMGPKVIRSMESMNRPARKIATSGAWKDENTFEFMLRYYETPHHDTVTCRFEGDGGAGGGWKC